MPRLRLYALTGATAATLLLALVAAGTAGADPRANYCDGQGLWAASVFGGPRSTGAVFFDIFNQTPPAPSNDDGSEEFALASQLAAQIELGLGNAGEGDKYHFRFETKLVEPSGATARGHGFMWVKTENGVAAATFVVAGKGTHPMGGGPLTEGSFKLSGGGEIDCALAAAVDARAFVDVAYEDGMTDNDVFVNMARCPEGTEPGGEGCTPPGD